MSKPLRWMTGVYGRERGGEWVLLREAGPFEGRNARVPDITDADWEAARARGFREMRGEARLLPPRPWWRFLFSRNA